MKVIQVGPSTVSVNVADGAVSLKADVSGSVGGGAAAGVASAKASVELDLGAQQAADLAIALLEAHFPVATGLLEMIKAGVDAEIKKVSV